MSLSVPAAGSGSTARPPGTMEDSPNVKGRPMGKRQECALPMGELTLKTSSGSPVTNDRCADDQEDETYGRFKSFLQDVNLQQDKEDGLGFLNLRKTNGGEYQEPLATQQGKNANDNLRMGEWVDHSKDDSSYWSDSPSLWDAIIEEDMDMFRIFQEEMETERQNQDIGDFG